LFWLHQDLNITGQHGATLGEDEDRNVGEKVDVMEAEVVTDLLPTDLL
jgi:hypothetical protein